MMAGATSRRLFWLLGPGPTTATSDFAPGQRHPRQQQLPIRTAISVYPPSRITNTDINYFIMPISVLRAPLARLSLLLRSSTTAITALPRISSKRQFFSTLLTPCLNSRILALRISSESWNVAHQQQRRGMKVRSSVKKLCEGCKVR